MAAVRLHLLRRGDGRQLRALGSTAKATTAILAIDAATQLSEPDINARMVSMRCVEWFADQTTGYRESMLPAALRARVAVEAGRGDDWYRWVDLDGRVVSVEEFGESGCGPEVLRLRGMHLDAASVASMIDHTLLKPEATATDVTALINEAIELGTYSVYVSPSMLPLTFPAGATLKVAVVCGFPSSSIKAAGAAEAALIITQDADEIDIDIGVAMAGRFADVQAEIAAERASVPAPKVLKVIVGSAGADGCRNRRRVERGSCRGRRIRQDLHRLPPHPVGRQRTSCA